MLKYKYELPRVVNTELSKLKDVNTEPVTHFDMLLYDGVSEQWVTTSYVPGEGIATHSFVLIKSSGQTSIAADSTTDELTIEVNQNTTYSNLSITTTPETDTLNFDFSDTPKFLSLDFQVSTDTVTPMQGRLWYNEEDDTLDLGHKDGVIQQIGQEIYYHVINSTDANIPDGTLCCCISGPGNSGKLLVEPWNGTQKSETIIGLSTVTIPYENGDTGIGLVTAFGKVRGIRTDGANYGEVWEEGDKIYAGVSGGLTKYRPEAPNTKTLIGRIITSHSTNGTMFVRVTQSSNLGDDDLVELGTLNNDDLVIYNSTNNRFENKNITEIGTQINDYHETTYDHKYLGVGWVDRNESTLSFDAATRTLTLTPNPVANYLYEGKYLQLTEPVSVTIPETKGKNFITYDPDINELVSSREVWDVTEGELLVSYVCWNGTDGTVLDERHGVRDVEWHSWAHNTIGTRYESGFDLTYPSTANPDQILLTGGTIYDEDIRINLESSGRCRIWYEEAQAQYCWEDGIDNGGYDYPYKQINGTIQYRRDDYTWQPININKYIPVYVYASNDIIKSTYIYIPTLSAPFNNVGEAEASIKNFSFSPEIKLLYVLIFRGNGSLEAIDDYRLSTTVPGGGATSTTAAAVSFTPYLNLESTTVQSVIEELNDEVYSLSITNLSDVNSSMTPIDGQALVYDDVNGWQAEDVAATGSSLPDQTGNDGKFLTTDGTTASWANVPNDVDGGSSTSLYLDTQLVDGGNANG